MHLLGVKMAAIHELLAQVQDESLQARLEDEINKLSKQKQFGLVFEEHLPECTPLFDVPIKRGSRVALRNQEIIETYLVKTVDKEQATCISLLTKEETVFSIDDIVAVAEFGEPIYPFLQPIDSICNAPDSNLWHTLIEADNYHALQLLDYMYAGKIDCIYIDPPYNKEDSKDWKYNCNYVDGNDQYRHSKWLSMIERRLVLAKRLLNPNGAVLIVTIDDLEYLHLGMLLEQLFPEARIQMISDVINPKGTMQRRILPRTDEYIFFVWIGEAEPVEQKLSKDWLIGNAENTKHNRYRWQPFVRANISRDRTPSMFYPIFINEDGTRVTRVGDSLGRNIDRNTIAPNPGERVVFPINTDGEEAIWHLSQESFMKCYEKGYIRLGSFNELGMSISYLSSGMQKKLDEGTIPIVGHNQDGSVIFDINNYDPEFIPGTQWRIKTHDATEHGTKLLQSFIGKKFSYPKSLYSTRDSLSLYLSQKPNALVLDFFAGSGTTLHAVNLLNAEDGGNRRCILVTNNEIGDATEKEMKAAGYRPGDPEWEALGIAKNATWPRTVCSIKGVDINGKSLSGEYYTSLTEEKTKARKIVKIDFIADSLTTAQKKSVVKTLTQGKLPQNLVQNECQYVLSNDEKNTSSILFDVNAADEWIEELIENAHITDLYVITKNNKLFTEVKEKIRNALGDYTIEEAVTIPMSNGFKSNVIYFKLGFLDKTSLALGKQFRELLPLLWLKAGAKGVCPTINDNETPQMMICRNNGFAVLIDDTAYASFAKQINAIPEIETVYIVTDSNAGYREMKSCLKAENTYQLYRDYLDNFRINAGRKK